MSDKGTPLPDGAFGRSPVVSFEARLKANPVVVLTRRLKAQKSAEVQLRAHWRPVETVVIDAQPPPAPSPSKS